MILVVGAKGMLGQDLMDLLGEGARGLDLPEIDITSPESVKRTLLTLRPEVVINCAARTDVDGCEGDREGAFRVNAEGVRVLAEATKEGGSLLVQVSTDYVFDGNKGSACLEDDPVNPLSVYGASKLAGEEAARLNPNHLIVRTQWLYGLKGKNFVETMLKLGSERGELTVVDDQIGSPTWTVDLAKGLKALIDAGCRGTYHAVNSGSCSWNGFAKAIFEEAGMKVEVKPMTTTELNRPATRPLYSVLDCGKLARDAGFTPQHWREALKSYLALRSA